MPLHLGPHQEPGTLSPRIALPSRRDFLTRAAGLLTAAPLVLSGCRGTPGAKGNPGGWYAWLSDIHLAADPTAMLREECMVANLRAVLADILSGDEPPQSVMINGDLALKNGQPGDYATLLDTTVPLLKARIPLHCTLGNHDDRLAARTALGEAVGNPDSALGRCVGEVEGPGVRFLLLDSMIAPNKTPGTLGPEQLQWLADRLDGDAKTPTIVFVHHNLNSTWESALLDTDALLDVLQPRTQVKMVVFGHTHVFNVRQVNGLHMVNLPAVGYRFQPKQPLGWCQFRPLADGCDLQLRTIGGDQRKDGWTTRLAWRAS